MFSWYFQDYYDKKHIKKYLKKTVFIKMLQGKTKLVNFPVQEPLVYENMLISDYDM